MRVLGYFGKILLFFAGLVIVFELFDKELLDTRARTAQQTLDEVKTQQDLTRLARPLEKAAEAMVRHVLYPPTQQTRRGRTRRTPKSPEPLPVADLTAAYLTAKEFEDWANRARAVIAAEHDKFPEGALNELDRSAREFLLCNERIPAEQRAGLQIIHNDLERRGLRHWKFGMMLFGLFPLVAVVLLCVSGERNSVRLGFAFFLGASVALYIGGGLLQPPVLRQFRRAAARRRAFLAQYARARALTALAAAKKKRLFFRCAVLAYLIGSALDLWASRP